MKLLNKLKKLENIGAIIGGILGLLVGFVVSRLAENKEEEGNAGD
jgi:hypothetical protein